MLPPFPLTPTPPPTTNLPTYQPSTITTPSTLHKNPNYHPQCPLLTSQHFRPIAIMAPVILQGSPALTLTNLPDMRLNCPLINCSVPQLDDLLSRSLNCLSPATPVGNPCIMQCTRCHTSRLASP